MEPISPPGAWLGNSCKYTNTQSCAGKGAACFINTSWYGARFFLANKQNTMEKIVNNRDLWQFLKKLNEQFFQKGKKKKKKKSFSPIHHFP